MQLARRRSDRSRGIGVWVGCRIWICGLNHDYPPLSASAVVDHYYFSSLLSLLLLLEQFANHPLLASGFSSLRYSFFVDLAGTAVVDVQVVVVALVV